MPVPHAKPIEEGKGPCNFVAGFNMPGYLPETEPEFFEHFDDAKRYILNWIEHHGDIMFEEDDAEALSTLAQDINLESEPFCSAETCDLVYWVEPVEECK